MLVLRDLAQALPPVRPGEREPVAAPKQPPLVTTTKIGGVSHGNAVHQA